MVGELLVLSPVQAGLYMSVVIWDLCQVVGLE
jgi:hypothetical protein